MKTELHEFQFSILRKLLFSPGSHFSELNEVEVTSDHFSFHIKKLINLGLIAKEENKYFLTTEGKEFAGRMDTETMKLEKQAKNGVALHAIRIVKGETQYLIHKRLKEPYYGWYGSHSGKIHWGEMPLEAAKREFFEETGLTGDFEMKGIIHCRDYNNEGKLLEDKFFWVFKIENVKGEFREKTEEGENIWMTEKEIRKIKNNFASFEEMKKILNAKKLVYEERERVVEGY